MIGHAGECADGLSCECVGACADPMIADAPSTCVLCITCTQSVPQCDGGCNDCVITPQTCTACATATCNDPVTAAPVTAAPIQCGTNEVLKSCGTACQDYCGNTQTMCTRQCIVNQCECASGFKRETDSPTAPCVAQCPAETCTLDDGTTVADGWQGKGAGDNWCNSCVCNNGGLACTKMGCGACPWESAHSGGDNVLLCANGQSCNGETDGWACCSSKGGRAQCPSNLPVMCAVSNGCAGGSDYCCAPTAGTCSGGVRGCGAQCADKQLNGAEWHDADGATYNCAWYANGNRCAQYGGEYANGGLTANDACCACGGGDATSLPAARSAPGTGGASHGGGVTGAAAAAGAASLLAAIGCVAARRRRSAPAPDAGAVYHAQQDKVTVDV